MFLQLFERIKEWSDVQKEIEWRSDNQRIDLITDTKTQMNNNEPIWQSNIVDARDVHTSLARGVPMMSTEWLVADRD